MRTLFPVSLDPKELQDLLDELKASRASRKTAWDILQELRSILNEHGVVLAPPAAKNIGGRSSQDVHPILFQGGSNLLLTLQQSERGIKGWLWSLII
jgi:hypothetical protein